MAQNATDVRIISQMARKYSQYRLPDPSELEEEPSVTPLSDGFVHGSPQNTLLFVNDNITNIANYDNDNDNSDEEDNDDQDDEDEDLLSDNQTMLSHHSSFRDRSTLAINTSNHTLNKSSSQRRVLFDPVTPMQEIREIQMDKELFDTVFDKYIDESQEGDVDLEEFKKGFAKLGVAMNDAQITKLFGVLLMNDSDNSGQYVDKEQFSDFLTRRYDAPQLQAFQEIILSTIIDKTKKNAQRHQLMSADDAKEWDPAEVSLAELEMRKAMEQMVDGEMMKMQVVQEFNEEIERRNADPAFCELANAEDWDCYEVSQWVDNGGYGYSMKHFFDAGIDGNMLLFDLNAEMCLNKLGITQMHLNKFMRYLSDLKKSLSISKQQLVVTHCLCEYNLESLVEIRRKEMQIEMKEMQSLNEEKTLSMQRELNKSEKQIVLLIRENSEFQNKAIDYDSMKHSFDDICQQLNSNKKAVSTLKMELENNKQTHSLNVDCIKRQFERELGLLDEQMSELKKENSKLLRDKQEMKENRDTSALFNVQSGPLYAVSPSCENPYLVRDLPDKSSYITQLQTQKKNNNSFASAVNAMQWSCEEVAYWLTQINCQSYVPQFLEQFVDGNILLRDINSDNLVSDLGVKRIHCGKILREIDKIEKEISGANKLVISDFICAFSFEYKHTHSPNSSVYSHSRNASLAMSAFSQYSEGDLREKSPTPPMPNGVDLDENWQKYLKHLQSKNKHLSQMFVRADFNLKKYVRAVAPFKERIETLESQNKYRIRTIEKLNKRLQKRTVKLNKYKRMGYDTAASDVVSNVGSAVVGRASDMASRGSFDELTPEQERFFVNGQRQYDKINGSSKYRHVSQSQEMTQEMMNDSTERHKRKKNKRQHRVMRQRQHRSMKLRNNSNSSLPQITGYVSTGSVGSIRSAPPSEYRSGNGDLDDDSMIGTLSKWAQYYWYTEDTPGK